PFCEMTDPEPANPRRRVGGSGWTNHGAHQGHGSNQERAYSDKRAPKKGSLTTPTARQRSAFAPPHDDLPRLPLHDRLSGPIVLRRTNANIGAPGVVTAAPETLQRSWANVTLAAAGPCAALAFVHGLYPSDRDSAALFDEVFGQSLGTGHLLGPRVAAAQVAK